MATKCVHALIPMAPPVLVGVDARATQIFSGVSCDVFHERKHVQKMPITDANGTRKLSETREGTPSAIVLGLGAESGVNVQLTVAGRSGS